MNEEDARLVRELFSRDFIQVLVATAELCWELDWSAQLVIVMGSDATDGSPLDTCFYDGKDHRYVDYPIVDLLEMIGFASRGGKYASGKAVVMTHISKKDYLNKFLFEPLPVESTLHLHLADVLNAAVTSRTVASMQDAIEWLTWFFFYRRLPQNPNFYSLDGVSDAQLSDFLSTLIENTATDLQDAGAVAIDEQSLEPLNLGVLSAHLYIHVQTTKLFSLSITAKTKRRGLLQILSSAEEFEEVLRSLCEISRVAPSAPARIAPAAAHGEPPAVRRRELHARFPQGQRAAAELLQPRRAPQRPPPRHAAAAPHRRAAAPRGLYRILLTRRAW